MYCSVFPRYLLLAGHQDFRLILSLTRSHRSPSTAPLPSPSPQRLGSAVIVTLTLLLLLVPSTCICHLLSVMGTPPGSPSSYRIL